MANTTIEATGNLASDAELKFTQNGACVLNFRICATNRRRNRNTNDWEDIGEPLWLSCVMWGRAAETWGETGQLVKGARVTVTGTLALSSFVNKLGANITNLDVSVNTIGVLESRTQNTPTQHAATTAPAQVQPGTASTYTPSQTTLDNDPWATHGNVPAF